MKVLNTVVNPNNTMVVLNDGETYTSMEGCEVLVLKQRGLDRLDEGHEVNDLTGSEIVGRYRIADLLEAYLGK